jgi:hypothetical protein
LAWRAARTVWYRQRQQFQYYRKTMKMTMKIQTRRRKKREEQHLLLLSLCLGLRYQSLLLRLASREIGKKWTDVGDD